MYIILDLQISTLQLNAQKFELTRNTFIEWKAITFYLLFVLIDNVSERIQTYKIYNDQNSVIFSIPVDITKKQN